MPFFGWTIASCNFLARYHVVPWVLEPACRPPDTRQQLTLISFFMDSRGRSPMHPI